MDDNAINTGKHHPAGDRTMRVANTFNQLAEAYDAWFSGDGRWAFETEIRAFKDILPQLPRPWVEVGTGSGRFARALGMDIAIDPARRLLTLAGKRGVDAIQGVGEFTPLQASRAGAVFLIATLCFLPSPLAVLREASRILKPEGKLVVGTILKESPWGQLYTAQQKAGHRFYQYAEFYGLQTLDGLLNEAGFAVTKAVSTLFQPPGQVIEIESPLSGFFSEAGFTVVVTGKRDN